MVRLPHRADAAVDLGADVGPAAIAPGEQVDDARTEVGPTEQGVRHDAREHQHGDEVGEAHRGSDPLATSSEPGPYGVGNRLKIAYTRAMISAALSGQLDRVEYRKHPVFNLDMPVTCPGVPDGVLDPRSTWPDAAKYDVQAAKLAKMFADNFKTFENDVAPSVKTAGPNA